MRWTRISLWILVAGCLFTVPGFSQVQLSIPFTFLPPVTAHVDDGGNLDFRCGSNTYPGHCGTDFGVGYGTPVYAAADGPVVAINTGCPDGYYCSTCGGLAGNYVSMRPGIDPNWGTFFVAHLSQVSVSVGDYPSCTNGPMLGRSGNSGCTTGPHTHFQAYHYGSPSAPRCLDDDPYAGDCGGPFSYWVCQDYNQEISCTDCP